MFQPRVQVRRMNQLLTRPRAINVGLDLLAATLEPHAEWVQRVDWRPPSASAAVAARLDSIEIEQATAESLARVRAAEQWLVDVQPAGVVVPGWSRIWYCTPVRQLVAADVRADARGSGGRARLRGCRNDTAEEMAQRGGVRFEPCHHHSVVGPMAGVLTQSMPVYVVENRAFGNEAYASLNEGLGKVLRYGANGPEVLERLVWMRDILGRFSVTPSGGQVVSTCARFSGRPCRWGMSVTTATEPVRVCCSRRWRPTLRVAI